MFGNLKSGGVIKLDIEKGKLKFTDNKSNVKVDFATHVLKEMGVKTTPDLNRKIKREPHPPNQPLDVRFQEAVCGEWS